MTTSRFVNFAFLLAISISTGLLLVEPVNAQWLDIGAYHHVYDASGARNEVSELPGGMEYPAILRNSGHIYAKGLWIGVKDWTDTEGQNHPYFVARIGPRENQKVDSFPVQSRLIGRYEDTVVEVNGAPSFDNEAELDEIDPALAADRIIHTIHNTSVGVTVDRKVFAYTNEYHDNYHIIEYEYCNTGNTDSDEEIELPGQTLNDVRILRLHRWRGNEQAAWATRSDQVWGRYTTHDVVGDGHAEYPVDFTAQYGWFGYDLLATAEAGYSNLGSPVFSDENSFVAEGDSIGRLSGPTMMGRAVIHADRSANDSTFDRDQPTTLAWLDNDGPLLGDGLSHETYYEEGIIGAGEVKLGEGFPSCTTCSLRKYPHFADLRQPNGEFWNPTGADLLQGGFSPTTGYGPYELAPGACVNITVSEGVAGLSFDAATKIGQAYKRNGMNRDSEPIAYDADGDCTIDATPFDYARVFVGTETQTKNQWVMSARDSLFQMFYRAQDLYAASNNMAMYPIPEPPRAPTQFNVSGQQGEILLEWTPAQAGPDVVQWEVYRTKNREDNLYVNGCLHDSDITCGYERIAALPAENTSFIDTDVSPDVEYYYYVQGIGELQSDDPGAILGTPGGVPLRSSRYLTQTYTPVTLQTSTGVDGQKLPGRFVLEGNYPNPFITETRIRYTLPVAADVWVVVYDILGREVHASTPARKEAGPNEYLFEASGLAGGTYIYVLQAGTFKAEGMMLLMPR